MKTEVKKIPLGTIVIDSKGQRFIRCEYDRKKKKYRLFPIEPVDRYVDANAKFTTEKPNT